MGGGGGSTQHYEADLPFAMIARAQWNDYKRRYMPIEQQLIREGTNDAQYGVDSQMAKDSVGDAFGLQSGATARDMGRMGVTMSPDEQAAADQNMSIAKTSAMVGEANGARDNVWDRINGVMNGGLSSIDRTIRR